MQQSRLQTERTRKTLHNSPLKLTANNRKQFSKEEKILHHWYKRTPLTSNHKPGSTFAKTISPNFDEERAESWHWLTLNLSRAEILLKSVSPDERHANASFARDSIWCGVGHRFSVDSTERNPGQMTRQGSYGKSQAQYVLFFYLFRIWFLGSRRLGEYSRVNGGQEPDHKPGAWARTGTARKPVSLLSKTGGELGLQYGDCGEIQRKQKVRVPERSALCSFLLSFF